MAALDTDSAALPQTDYGDEGGAAQQKPAPSSDDSWGENDAVAPSGPEYLKTLSPQRAQLVQAIGEGRLPAPHVQGRNGAISADAQALIADVAQAYPKFDAVDAPRRVAAAKAWTSGKFGQQATTIGTALEHAMTLEDSIKGLGNVRSVIPFATHLVNSVRNSSNDQDGDPKITAFRASAEPVLEEMSKAFHGGSSEGSVSRLSWTLPESGSPEQQRAAVQTYIKLLKGKLDELQSGYNKAMGTTGQGLPMVSDEAGKNLNSFLDPHYIHSGIAAPADGAGAPPADGGSNPPSGGTPTAPIVPTGPAPGGATIQATQRDEVSPQARRTANELEAGVNSGRFKTPDEAMAFADANGFNADRKSVEQAYAYRAQGGRGYIDVTTPIAMDAQKTDAVGAGALGLTDAVTFGTANKLGAGVDALHAKLLGDDRNLSDIYGSALARNNQTIDQAESDHPVATLVGETGGFLLGGGIAGAGVKAALGAGDAARGAALLGRLPTALRPVVGDAAYGAAYGAGSSDNLDDVGFNSVKGAALAGAGGIAGRTLARPILALSRTNAGQRGIAALGNGYLAAKDAAASALGRGDAGPSARFGLNPVAAPSFSDRTVSKAVGDQADAIRGQLSDAADLGVPMALADTHPGLASLAGASVRRSPDAARFAQDTLLPRSRGQIDRFSDAVTRDLGPVANIPQVSADLTAQARAASKPLYEAAYAAPGASSVDLSDLAGRPSMKSGLNRAYSIAQEEGRDPTALGFDLDAQGNVVLNRTPSFQTLDYVKRGLDDSLEPHRDSITGKLALNETTRAINNTKNTLLSRIDEVNPAYKDARAAYAGPAQAKDALARGQDASTLSPDELAMQVSNQSPEHLAQMQTGFRSALSNRANSVRDAANPFDATLGNPNARARVDTLFPDNPGNQNLFRQRDLEAQLARTNTAVIGGSQTAERRIADQAFEAPPALEGALHAGAAIATHGGSLPGTAARLAGYGARDAVRFGIGRGSVAKASDLAELLLNTDPHQSSAILDDILQSAQAYKSLTQSQSTQYGRPLGSSVAALGGMYGRASASDYDPAPVAAPRTLGELLRQNPAN